MFKHYLNQILSNSDIKQVDDIQKLKSLIKNGIWTNKGSLAFTSKIKSRSAKFTKNAIDDNISKSDLRELEKVVNYLKFRPMILVRRRMGSEAAFNCNYLVTSDHVRIAYGWSMMLSPQKSGLKNIFTVGIPEWPKRKILVDPVSGITFALGSDYTGEVKKSFLRMWMYKVKQEGLLGLHAGSKLVRIGKHKIGQLYLGLSATGKTTLTCHSFHGDTLMYQDDVGALTKDGRFHGTEGNGLYVKTDHLSLTNQGVLYHATTSKNAYLENVYIKNGEINFDDDSITSNGRASILRSDVRNASRRIDLSRVDQIFFITRNPLQPAVVRLNTEQAAAFFMLGESVESSAGDPSKAGQFIRVVGTNPFIVGSRGREGNIFYRILKKNSKIECFVLNTGGLGEKKFRKIQLAETVEIIRNLVQGKVIWKKDDFWGYERAEMPGIDHAIMVPELHYSAHEYKQKIKKLRLDRKNWLKKFNDLNKTVRFLFR